MRALSRHSLSLLGVLSAALIGACGSSDTDPSEDTTPEPDAVTDLSEPDTEPSEDVVPDATGPDAVVPDYDKPAFFPDDSAPDEVLSFDGFEAPVRVVYDDRGIPHIYAANTADLFRAQGYVTARDRIFQMHTLRSAAEGRLAEFSGTSALSGDIFLRMLRLGSVAEQMAAAAEAGDPLVWEGLTSFADGVNAYLRNLRAGNERGPIEVTVFGTAMLRDWTPADTMAIVRLQTWDLGFGGVVEELGLLEHVLGLKERFSGTALDGIWKDAADFRPAARTPTVVPEGGIEESGSFDLDAVLDLPFFQKLATAHIAEIRAGVDAMEHIPHRAFRGASKMYGSNNWVVSGAHTEHGKPIVANDTHLSLRNPAVFYQVHLDTKRAGGDISVNGVNFAGAPGIVLGHNDRVAWGATVVYSDVTDLYVERFVPVPDGADHGRLDYVFQNGEDEVAVVKRVETFRFAQPSGGECVDAAPDYVRNLEFTQRVEGTTCVLELTILDVPGHGPVIPWSFRETEDGELLGVSWKWTGFEPTEELGAIMRLAYVDSWEDFKEALNRFGVGAQNWIYGDADGNIGWYPSHRMPIRKHIEAGNTDYPPFLPMPGDTGECEWEGFVPREALPQAYNPEQGFLITANSDPLGFNFDNDPFNDGIYFGYIWDVGYRMDQIDRRIRDHIEAGNKFDFETMASIQGDHRSRVGEDLVPALLAAVEAARSGDDPRAAAHLNAAVEEAADRLATWEALSYEAASGVGEDAESDAARASVCTSIFNAWMRFFVENLIFDEGLASIGGSMAMRLVRRIVLEPEALYTHDPEVQPHPVWDDLTTADVVETPAEIMVKSLAQAVAFLADPDRVGVPAAGGFGTADMSDWRWGALHTVTLRHNVSTNFDIPRPNVLPHGFPRPGDLFGVDASSPGLFGRSFTYAHGAAIRNVYDMTDPVVFHGVIPGGQSENPSSPYYDDGANAWAVNEAPRVRFGVDEVLEGRTRVVDFVTPAAD